METSVTEGAIRIARAHVALVESFLREGLEEETARFEAREFIVSLLVQTGEDALGIWSDFNA
jgi:hypothetical protein